MTLYDLKNDMITALEMLEINDSGEISEDSLDLLDTIKGEFTDKCESVALYVKDLNAKADAIKAEADSLKHRAEMAQKKADRLKEYLSNCMQLAECNKLETSRCALSFRKSTAVSIVDEFELPEMYLTKKVTESPNKKLITEALKNGEIIPGASLVEKMNLQIK